MADIKLPCLVCETFDHKVAGSNLRHCCFFFALLNFKDLLFVVFSQVCSKRSFAVVYKFYFPDFVQLNISLLAAGFTFIGLFSIHLVSYNFPSLFMTWGSNFPYHWGLLKLLRCHKSFFQV